MKKSNNYIAIGIAIALCSSGCSGHKTEEATVREIHPLDEYFCLDYLPEEVENPEALDAFTTSMVLSLWDEDEGTPIADHYWQWAQKVTKDIDSLYVNCGMFKSDSLDRYDEAISQIAIYLSDAGTQASMNCRSYVCAIGHNYLMQRKNIELARALPNLDMQQEYRLYSDYQNYSENFWEEVHDKIFGHYSDRPREVNTDAEERFDARAEVVSDFLEVVQDGKSIQATGKRPSKREIKKAFHEAMPGMMRPVGDNCEYPTDTLGALFLKWIDFRDELAKKMPDSIAPSYRNQTTNIILAEIPKEPWSSEE